MSEEKQIVFVYNANSTIISMSVDYLHKLFSPATYQCSLCLLTHGNFGIKREWKEMLQQLKYPTVFLYKDDFIQRYPEMNILLFPAVFIKHEEVFSVLLAAGEIQELDSLRAFADVLQSKLLSA